MTERLLYFAYGSNLHPLRLQQRVPSSRAFASATLDRYKLQFHKRGADGSGKCNVLYSGRGEDLVIGVLYAMSASEKQLLDQAEGLGKGYNEVSVSVTTIQKEQYQAFCYVANPAYVEDQLSPFIWYKQLVVQGACLHKLPAAYIKRIAEVRAQIDTDAVRTELHLDILHRHALIS
jgi:gamma-glutamylcyclotransferase (GGCT)/AIG2-like uncharacterized protein YtfP